MAAWLSDRNAAHKETVLGIEMGGDQRKGLMRDVSPQRSNRAAISRVVSDGWKISASC